MNGYFNCSERIDRLVVDARAWVGTPWCANSSTRGVGVSCHNLPRALYIECGALPDSFPQIQNTPQGATAFNYMETFLDSRSEFQRVPFSEVAAGDLLGMFIPIDSVGKRIRQCVINHLGVVLPDKEFLHVLSKKHTARDALNVPPWIQTIVAVWRPVEKA